MGAATVAATSSAWLLMLPEVASNSEIAVICKGQRKSFSLNDVHFGVAQHISRTWCDAVVCEKHRHCHDVLCHHMVHLERSKYCRHQQQLWVPLRVLQVLPNALHADWHTRNSRAKLLCGKGDTCCRYMRPNLCGCLPLAPAAHCHCLMCFLTAAGSPLPQS